ncbi:alanine:cation symporter family protein, partial [Enterocloster clostridioformis]|uniref:alanine:cation symporter family protein n=1 Tax=Enterocloster clostridioformis TaxID=1531 RepID=UPI003A8573A5
MRFGVARGLYSNEAGEGSAAVIHFRGPGRPSGQTGLYGVAEVLVDTMVICSTTGFSILASGVPLEGANAASLAAEA